MRKPFGPFLLCIAGLSACPVIARPLTPEQRQQLRAMLQFYRYNGVLVHMVGEDCKRRSKSAAEGGVKAQHLPHRSPPL